MTRTSTLTGVSEPDRHDLVLLQRAEQPRLQRRARRRRSRRGTGCRGRPRGRGPGASAAAPVKAPAHVAESSLSSSPSASARAVDRDEPALGAVGVAVDRAGDQLLAGAGLAQHQHRRLRRRDPRQRLHHLDDGGTVPHQRGPRRLACLRARAAAPPSRRRPASRRRPSERASVSRKRGQVVRLADEVVRAGPDRFARRRGVAEGGEHQHQRAGIALAEDPQQVEPALLRHPQVGEHRVERTDLVHLRERFVRRERRHHDVGLALEHFGEQAAGLLVVVHQQQSRRDLGTARSCEFLHRQSEAPAHAARAGHVHQVAAEHPGQPPAHRQPEPAARGALGRRERTEQVRLRLGRRAPGRRPGRR